MDEKKCIEKKRKVIIVAIVLVLLVQVVLIGRIAEGLFKMEFVGYEVQTNLEGIKERLLNESIKLQTSRVETIRDIWRNMYGYVGSIDDKDLSSFLDSIVSTTEGIDINEDIYVIDRETGTILLPHDYRGESIEEFSKDDYLIASIMSSRDIVYPDFFIFESGGRKDHSDLYNLDILTFGTERRVFCNKVVIPRPRTGGQEYIVIAGFREDRVMESYSNYLEGLYTGVVSIINNNHMNLYFIMVNMIIVIILGFILTLSIRLIVGDLVSWEKKNGK